VVDVSVDTVFGFFFHAETRARRGASWNERNRRIASTVRAWPHRDQIADSSRS